MRPAPTARDRVRVAAGIAVGLGLLVYVYSAYHALEAGGLTPTSRLGACAQAATGRFDPHYRPAETVELTHGFFPPTATCHWSGGTEAVLVPPTWTWTGIVLVALGILVLVAVRFARRR